MAVDGQRFMTKTQHYRKVTKPLLERKRRARMNLYLDELKDLIVDTMEAQGEHIAKLEKADILELTVNYLRTHKHEIAASVAAQHHLAIHQQQQHPQTTHQQQMLHCNGGDGGAGAGAAAPPIVNVEKFRAGYTQAAYEVSRMFATVPGLDVKFGTKLMKHLGYQLKDLQYTFPAASVARAQSQPSQSPPPTQQLSLRAASESSASEKALNLEVVKRCGAASSTPPAAAEAFSAEQMRRAYQLREQQQLQQHLQQQQKHQLQQKMFAKMQRAKQMALAMEEMDEAEAEAAEQGGECLWRPW